LKSCGKAMFSATCCTSKIEADLAQKVFRSAYSHC
jgi:hypothetical protein